jgi:hypothetical protein
MNEITIECSRCHRDATNGLAYNLLGPSTGHNRERGVLCPDCVIALRWFLSPKHVSASDPVTALGLAHISTCLECNLRFGGDAPTVQHQMEAERFARGGFAQ